MRHFPAICREIGTLTAVVHDYFLITLRSYSMQKLHADNRNRRKNTIFANFLLDHSWEHSDMRAFVVSTGRVFQGIVLRATV